MILFFEKIQRLKHRKQLLPPCFKKAYSPGIGYKGLVNIFFIRLAS